MSRENNYEEEELKLLKFGRKIEDNEDLESIQVVKSDSPKNFIPMRGEKIEDNTNFIFYFGTAGSGKSVILSTMLYAMRTQFGVIEPKVGTPNSDEANILLSNFFENMRKGVLPERTTRDKVTRLDLVFGPNNKSQKVKPINLTFLEISGENHSEIKGGNDYPKNISKYLQANIPITFIIVTSYQSAHQEDAIIYQFFGLLKEKGINLENTNLILVISKWDISGTESPTEEDLHFFIKDRLPMIHGFLEKYGLTQTYYTVGTIEKINGEDRITNLNLDSAKNLSKWLYKSITGVDTDYEGTIWEQLKWSIGMK